MLRVRSGIWIKEPDFHLETLTYIIHSEALWHLGISRQLSIYHADRKDIIYIKLCSFSLGLSIPLLLETGHTSTIKNGLIFSIWKLKVILPKLEGYCEHSLL